MLISQQSGRAGLILMIAAVFPALSFCAAFAEEHSEQATQPPEVRQKGYLGISVDFVPSAVRAQTTLEEGFGLSVIFVVPGGPGHNAGLKRYDVLSAFGDQKLTQPDGLRTLAAAKAPGDVVQLTVFRRGQVQVFPITMGDLRDAPMNLVPKGAGADQRGPLIDSLVELIRRGTEGAELEFKQNEDSEMQLEMNDSISGLLSDLRKRSDKEGIRWKTVEVNHYLNISTQELDIVIASHGKMGKAWITARRKNGDAVFEGPLDKKTPRQLLEIIENTPTIQQLPDFPKSK
ncbi:MAG: hypothetical protein ACI9R3_002806 [Verrucomicrobiales bacterium]|jgi:hypothetical protein